ncbi:MAG: hypothetical protein Q8N06_02880 [Hydrogenophaga sp.]|nr:hypothetical protein [Hydrogenophaga sp.]
MRKAKVTEENKAEAQRLRDLWNKRAVKISQAEFGEIYKVGNQSAVGQFLRGVVPLSLNAAKGFAEGLGSQIDEFSPRLAAIASAAGKHAGSPGTGPLSAPDLTTLNRAELQLVMMFRQLTPDDQASLLTQASKLFTKGN